MDDIKVVSSTGGKYCYSEQERKRIYDYNEKYKDSEPHERFCANMRIRTAILNSQEVEDE